MERTVGVGYLDLTGCMALGMTGPKSLEEEISDLKSSDKVDAELEAMKAALKAKGD